MTNSILKSIVVGAVFVTGSLLTNGVLAQNGALTSAEFYITPSEAKYEKALEKVRQATFHDKTKNDARTWYVRAKVFTSIFEAGAENKEVAALVNNPIDSALISMTKALEIEKAEGDDKYTKRIEDPAFQSDLGMETGLQARIKNALLNKVQKYQEAENFEKAYESMLPIVTYLPQDTTNLIYVAYFASKAEKMQESAVYYEELGDIKEYTGGVEAYQAAAYSYYKLEDSTNFLRILDKGIQNYPREPYFITNSADIYIRRKDYPKAIELLKKANEIEPNVKTLTNIALMYQQEDQLDKALEYYQKVLELDAQDYDATYALALHYYRKAATEFNALEVEQQEIKDPKMKSIIENADKSLIYAKKAEEINSDDETLYTILKDLYIMKDDKKNADLMKKKIEANK